MGIWTALCNAWNSEESGIQEMTDDVKEFKESICRHRWIPKKEIYGLVYVDLLYNTPFYEAFTFENENLMSEILVRNAGIYVCPKCGAVRDDIDEAFRCIEAQWSENLAEEERAEKIYQEYIDTDKTVS